MSEQAQAAPICGHYWAWVSPAGTSNSARLCMTCHQPDPDWLNTLAAHPPEPEASAMHPAAALREARECRGLSMRQAAAELGIAVSSVHKIEHRKGDPSWSLGQRILAWAVES